MGKHGPHEWTGDGFHCTTCWGSYHCAQCGDASGMQGHFVKDGDDWFFTCQESERAERWRADLLRKLSKR